MMSEEPKKRGRKRTSNLYFGPEQEEAVVKFLTSESYSERNKIYNEFLRYPINKMVESIIRRYKLYRKEYDYEDVHADTLSFLVTKMHNFKPDKNKHTVSYHMVVMGYNTKMKDLEKFNKMNKLYDINIDNTNNKLFDKSIYTNGRNFRSIYNYKPNDRERQKIPVNIQFNPEYHIIQSNEHTNKNSKKLIVDGIIESNNIIQEGQPNECAKCSKDELIKLSNPIQNNQYGKYLIEKVLKY